MIDDIGKIIQAITKVISTATTMTAKLPSALITPLRIKAKILSAYANIGSMLSSAISSLGSFVSGDKYLEKLMKSLNKLATSSMNKAKDIVNKLLGDDKEKEKKDKSKIDIVLKNIDNLNKQFNKVLESIGELEKEEGELDKKISNITSNDSKYSEELEKIKDPKDKLEYQKTEMMCKIARLQGLSGDMNKLNIKTKNVSDELGQQIAKLPPNLLMTIDAIKDWLLNILIGIESPQSEQFDPEKIIKELMELVDKIIGQVTSLPVPEIPGLSQLNQILQALKMMTQPISGKSKTELKDLVPIKPNIPTYLVDVIQDIETGIQTIVINLPFILINLIFQMLDVIISLFDKIASVIGVPEIPYPLNLVPNVIQMLPDIGKFILQGQIQLKNTIKGIAKDKLRELQALQFPSIPQSPQVLTGEVKACDRHKEDDSK